MFSVVMSGVFWKSGGHVVKGLPHGRPPLFWVQPTGIACLLCCRGHQCFMFREPNYAFATPVRQRMSSLAQVVCTPIGGAGAELGVVFPNAPCGLNVGCHLAGGWGHLLAAQPHVCHRWPLRGVHALCNCRQPGITVTTGGFHFLYNVCFIFYY